MRACSSCLAVVALLAAVVASTPAPVGGGGDAETAIRGLWREPFRPHVTHVVDKDGVRPALRASRANVVLAIDNATASEAKTAVATLEATLTELTHGHPLAKKHTNVVVIHLDTTAGKEFVQVRKQRLTWHNLPQVYVCTEAPAVSAAADAALLEGRAPEKDAAAARAWKAHLGAFQPTAIAGKYCAYWHLEEFVTPPELAHALFRLTGPLIPRFSNEHELRRFVYAVHTAERMVFVLWSAADDAAAVDAARAVAAKQPRDALFFVAPSVALARDEAALNRLRALYNADGYDVVVHIHDGAVDAVRGYRTLGLNLDSRIALPAVLAATRDDEDDLDACASAAECRARRLENFAYYSALSRHQDFTEHPAALIRRGAPTPGKCKEGRVQYGDTVLLSVTGITMAVPGAAKELHFVRWPPPGRRVTLGSTTTGLPAWLELFIVGQCPRGRGSLLFTPEGTEQSEGYWIDVVSFTSAPADGPYAKYALPPPSPPDGSAAAANDGTAAAQLTAEGYNAELDAWLRRRTRLQFERLDAFHEALERQASEQWERLAAAAQQAP